ncbi:MAG: CRISPR-associated protein Cas4 [Lachnospiraceae bacterium]|nr:CRISPR-associated protein Cas4 [Lachnospiraceae bacterium]
MEETERIPISSIKQFIYCKRRFALMFVDAQWKNNYKIVEGDLLHQKADNPFLKESRGDLFRSRSVPVYSDRFNIQGVCDIIEFTKCDDGVKIGNKRGLWLINPIEYKNGKPEESEADFCQLCAAAMCLEEMFHTTIKTGDIYYGKLKRRQTIEFSDSLRNKVVWAIDNIAEIIQSQQIPSKPEGQNCSLCSLQDICMPKIFDNTLSIEKTMAKLKKGALL